MIIVTGGSGFIGSAIVSQLNKNGYDNIIIVDSLGESEKWKNLRSLKFSDYIEKEDFIDKFVDNSYSGFQNPEAIIHMGACSSTTEKDAGYLIHNNFEYSKSLAVFSAANGIRFIYASSAATYGIGERGYKDDEKEIRQLRPLNMYGYSKQLFDLWALKKGLLEKHIGLKYFNVYGANESHKGDMRSVVHKAFGQILETGKVKLFKSYHPDYKDGEQMRDFIYIKDAVNMTLFFLEKRDIGGLFNIGTGSARTWKDLVSWVFYALGKEPNIEFIEMPEYLRPKYQYFTQADIRKIKGRNWNQKNYSLEEGVTEYIQHYLINNRYLGDEELS